MGNTDDSLGAAVSVLTGTGSTTVNGNEKKRAYAAIVDISGVAITIADEMKKTNRIAEDTNRIAENTVLEIKEKNRIAQTTALELKEKIALPNSPK